MLESLKTTVTTLLRHFSVKSLKNQLGVKKVRLYILFRLIHCISLISLTDWGGWGGRMGGGRGVVAPTLISEPNKVQKFQFQTPLPFTDGQKLYGPEISQFLLRMIQF